MCVINVCVARLLVHAVHPQAFLSIFIAAVVQRCALIKAQEEFYVALAADVL